MSGNIAIQTAAEPTTDVPQRAVRRTRKMDRRVRRTRDTLGDALMELMQEKPFDEITVQQVLDRAGVGRATFYKHYRDKDDLFLSDVEDFFAIASAMLTRNKADPRRLAPVKELFAHIADVRDFYTSLVVSGKVRDVMALGQGFFARSIEERMRLVGLELAPAQMKPTAHALAGSMFALLDYWIDHGMTTAPEEIDRLFHAMAWNGIKVRVENTGQVRSAR